jgi:DNA-directed RNA polymerase subunit RPC12/RpoP
MAESGCVPNSNFRRDAMHPFPTPQQVAHPKCANCSAPMWLASIEPDKRNYDKRTFECPRCQEETVEVVKYR